MPAAMWTPLPPARSGIADYAYELLGPLCATTDLVAVAQPTPAQTAAAQPPPTSGDRPCSSLSVVGGAARGGGFSVDGLADVDNSGKADAVVAGCRVVDPVEAGSRTTHVYQMGNHAESHLWIYRQALATPGIVVLHDTSLLGFHHGYLGGPDNPEFRREVDYAHGPIWGNADDPALLNGWPATEVDGVQVLDSRTLSMERRIVSSSRGVIVHDPYSASWLQARYPKVPVHMIPHGVTIREDTGRDETRARFGWQDDHVVFGLFGGFNRTKRMLVAVLAFAHLRRRWPNARLLIAGHPDYPDIVAEIRATVAQQGLTDSVHLELSPTKDDFERLITATDAVINLRWPTEGETSGVMARAFGAGRLVITSDLQQHRHLDPAYCWRVPTEPAAEAETLLDLLERAMSRPDEVRAAGARARAHARRTASWPVVAAAYKRVLDGTSATRKPARSALPGVNVFADPRATTGLSESARRHSEALLDAGVSMTFTEFNSRAWNRSVPVPRRLAELRRGKEHPVDLWLLNLNEFQLIPEHALDRHTIALWAWEFPEILDYTLVQLPRLDELWVVSSFVADAFRTATDIPITVIPNVVTQFDGVEADRARFALPDDQLVVLFSFSASSSDARKNPWGVIEAFRRAFRADERGRSAHMVIKVIDLHEFPELSVHLAEAVADVNGTLITADLTREEMDSLLASCDIYLSLHRSEGFGMGMAEAMALGKPVIATGYGGNVDFMPPGAAAVVGYDIRGITASDHRFGAKFAGWYRPGQLWAEPNVDQAARWLRRLADDPALRRAMGARGAEAVRATCSAEAVGAAMVRRLTELATVRT
ncbi:glycosyltransferase [Actinokineospora sp.]|uniref:glycosyltransferase n=1 Tax=Actinokineospora sp. TaxID=1872133 RepID=UPI0040383594